MRQTLILTAGLVLFVSGCTGTSANRATIQPAPRVVHDSKTPVAMTKPSVTQRLAAQRVQDAQVAQGQIAVEGAVKR